MNSKVDLTNYDDIASRYIEHVNRNASWNNMYERPYMISLFDDFEYKNVLDIGCGTGFYSIFASKQNASVTSIDASQEMLDYIKRIDHSNSLELIKSDLNKGLPFIENNSQHYIICSLVIHYLEDWDHLVAEMYRVLKPGGKVYLSTHHPFGDLIIHNKENYFEKYLVTDSWGDEEKQFPVNYFTRSLSDLLKPFLNSEFRVLKVDEPKPLEEHKYLNIKAYEYLMKNPAFLFFVLEK